MSHKAVSEAQYSLFDETVPLRQVEHVSELPKTAQALADAIGIDATIDLVKMFGGDEIKIPEVVDGTSRMWAVLVESIGREAAAKLVGHFGGVSVYVAKCEAVLRVHRNREIIRSYDAGEPFDAIRRRYKLSRSHLFRLLKKTV